MIGVRLIMQSKVDKIGWMFLDTLIHVQKKHGVCNPITHLVWFYFSAYKYCKLISTGLVVATWKKWVTPQNHRRVDKNNDQKWVLVNSDTTVNEPENDFVIV